MSHSNKYYTKTSPRSPCYWTDEGVAEIRDLFNAGYGADSIGIKLRIPNSAVRKLLATLGLHRTKAEAILMKYGKKAQRS